MIAPARAGALFILSTMIAGYTPASLPVVNANDNRSPAGIVDRDTLQVRLVVKMARWYPEEADGPFIEAPVFSEDGKAPSIPGPLIRVPAGTTVVATVTNGLADSTLWVHGLVTRPATANDSISIQPGTAHTFTFKAGAPGTYFYYAKAGTVRGREREQLSGALVVDTPGARRDDRILMINIWGEPVDSQNYDNVVAING
jgi:FtsP/CotA-like multicopper oxidase with cupredoxin domain